MMADDGPVRIDGMVFCNDEYLVGGCLVRFVFTGSNCVSFDWFLAGKSW